MRPALARSADPRHLFGRRGEEIAAKFLRRRGYQILYRNFRARRGGEVDLVCRHRDVLVFVEVKTRATLRHGRPAEAVDASKQRLIARGGLAWLRLLHHPDVPWRFDIVEVLIEPGRRPVCEVIEDAFALPDPYIY